MKLGQTPEDIFLMLSSTENIELIVQQTNLYYQQNKNKNDVLVTAEEMMKFIQVNIMMSIKRLPSYLNDQIKEPKKGDANFDKLCKIRPFIEKISETYLH